MTSTMPPSQINQKRMEELMRDGPRQARNQELQAACMAVVAFCVVFFWSIATQ
jgi:hypothetical protein